MHRCVWRRARGVLASMFVMSLGWPLTDRPAVAAPSDLAPWRWPPAATLAVAPSRLPRPLQGRAALVRQALRAPVTLRPDQVAEWMQVLVAHGVLADAAQAAQAVRTLCPVVATVAQQAACWVDLVTWAHDALVVGVGLGERGQLPPRHRKTGWTAREKAAQGQALAALVALAPADVAQAVQTGAPLATTVDAWLQRQGPGRLPLYAGLLAALRRYRDLALQPPPPLPPDLPRAGTWAYKHPAQALRFLRKLTPDHREALRARLSYEGYGSDVAVRLDLPGDRTSDRIAQATKEKTGAWQLDAPLDAALRSYQRDRGLHVTGLLDKPTLAALQVPMARRVEQVRLSLQRLRDTRVAALGLVEPGRGPVEPATGQAERPAQFLWVNLPAFRLELWRQADAAAGYTFVRGHAVQVGKAWQQVQGRRRIGRRTPLLTARVRDVVVDPAWYVPGSILPEVYEEFGKDPAYADRNRFEMRKVRQGGRDVEMLVMGAGPENLLGQVKFNFPNPHLVFAHDTTSRWRFLLPDRMTSHGCVRIHDAPALARDVLAFDQGEPWPQARWDRLRDERDEVSVPLRQPLVVHLAYLTADVAPDSGQVRFWRDWYALDDADLQRMQRAVLVRGLGMAVVEK